MRPAELKKASNGRLHSNEVLGGNPEQCKQKCPRPQVVGILNHIRGVGYTTRRAAIRFVVLKSSKISFERRRPPIGGSRFKNSTNFSDCNNKMTFFAKKSCHFGFSEGFSWSNRRFAPAVRSHPGRRTALKRLAFAGCALRGWIVRVNAPISRDLSTPLSLRSR